MSSLFKVHGARRATCALQSSPARAFSTASRLQTSGLKINAQRLWETLHETCEWGAANRHGEYVLFLDHIGPKKLTFILATRQTRAWLA